MIVGDIMKGNNKNREFSKLLFTSLLVALLTMSAVQAVVRVDMENEGIIDSVIDQDWMIYLQEISLNGSPL